MNYKPRGEQQKYVTSCVPQVQMDKLLNQSINTTDASTLTEITVTTLNRTNDLFTFKILKIDTVRGYS